MTEQAGQQKSE